VRRIPWGRVRCVGFLGLGLGASDSLGYSQNRKPQKQPSLHLHTIQVRKSGKASTRSLHDQTATLTVTRNP